MQDSHKSPKFCSLQEIPDNFFCDVKKAMIVHSKSSQKNGVLKKIENKLGNIDVNLFDTSSMKSNTDIFDIDKNFYKEKYDVILVIGGGTQIDIAKIIYLQSCFKLWKDELFSQNNSFFNKKTKFLAIVTLPGSGAESSKAAVINSNLNKCIYSSQHFVPDYVFYDLDSISSVKQSFLIIRLVDALTHAIESENSILFNKFSRLYSDYVKKKAVDFIENYLDEDTKKLKKNDIKSLCLLSLYGGLAQSEAGAGICHALAHTLESQSGLPHAECILLCSYITLDYKRTNVNKNQYLKIKKLFIELYDHLFDKLRQHRHNILLTSINVDDFIQKAKDDVCWKLERARIDEEQIKQIICLKIKNKKWNI